ncbi:DUF1788 domain-containing protein [Photobacterium phosphoreum]|uniref:Cytoplasmic protein n=2 Tax=Photobacterium TaxID=657 RepID=A0A2N4UWK9_9GAMM|nr:MULTISPECIES: DUF1788 domain-containing protein [Photobacterium]MCD9489945.1 DUF1788 domain-containing protein [Photobacterium phosphoreum]MCF2189211.1 DUF1788 domain-containing protein [Photobacterium phosphoreum]MCF2301074.1 DUF1788 domain-containing protein [Photobacterium phosphoreum]PLC59375.1 cytoplasmic protein [Photobacterium carnosum]
MKQLQQRLDAIQSRLESESFLHNKELGGEIGFYIFDYKPEHELAVREHIDLLEKKLLNRGKTFASINLFEMIIKLLKNEDILESTFEMQKKRSERYFFKALKASLEQNRVAEFIVKEANIENCDFIMLHGLGSVWPIVRGHGLLNALHAKVGQVPTVMFYPGVYDGSTLKPFGRIDSDNYYRAFKLA